MLICMHLSNPRWQIDFISCAKLDWLVVMPGSQYWNGEWDFFFFHFGVLFFLTSLLEYNCLTIKRWRMISCPAPYHKRLVMSVMGKGLENNGTCAMCLPILVYCCIRIKTPLGQRHMAFFLPFYPAWYWEEYFVYNRQMPNIFLIKLT